jgi:hypothetical protein
MANYVEQVVNVLRATSGIRRATKYVSPKEVIKATVRNRDRTTLEAVVTIGRPNYSERKLIKAARDCHEPFPIKKIMVQHV